jgi:hypothetical protein
MDGRWMDGWMDGLGMNDGWMKSGWTMDGWIDDGRFTMDG